jgi:hypothetical protein
MMFLFIKCLSKFLIESFPDFPRHACPAGKMEKLLTAPVVLWRDGPSVFSRNPGNKRYALYAIGMPPDLAGNGGKNAKRAVPNRNIPEKTVQFLIARKVAFMATAAGVPS